VPAGAALVDTNAAVSHLEDQFQSLSDSGSPLSIADGGVFPPDAYTDDQTQLALEEISMLKTLVVFAAPPGLQLVGEVAADTWVREKIVLLGLGPFREARNHFQGIARLRDGRHLVVSSGFANDGKPPQSSHLFVAEMGSRSATGPWGTNLTPAGTAPREDRVVAAYALDSEYWHAGGLGRLGDLLAVPLEVDEGTRSRVMFLRVGETPDVLERFDFLVDREGRPGGAAALTKLPDGHYLLAVSWEDTSSPQTRIDFYLSNDTDFRHGFKAETRRTWSMPADYVHQFRRDPAYQNIDFVTERGKGGRSRLFLVGTAGISHSSPTPTPLDPENDYADLWDVAVTAASFQADAAPALHFRATHDFGPPNRFRNFNGAAGTYVATTGALALYSGYHWRWAPGASGALDLHVTEFWARTID
jgi:hypothetical protein